jgi:hypothetical protein
MWKLFSNGNSFGLTGGCPGVMVDPEGSFAEGDQIVHAGQKAIQDRM